MDIIKEDSKDTILNYLLLGVYSVMGTMPGPLAYTDSDSQGTFKVGNIKNGQDFRDTVLLV